MQKPEKHDEEPRATQEALQRHYEGRQVPTPHRREILIRPVPSRSCPAPPVATSRSWTSDDATTSSIPKSLRGPVAELSVPRKLAVELSASPPTAQSRSPAVDAPPSALSKKRQQKQKQRPKRVRREQVELKSLRVEVRRLAHQLEQLKLCPRSRAAASKVPSNSIEERNSKALLPSATNSMWEGIAGRQVKDRIRAEQENQRLKDAQAECASVVLELRRKLEKSLNQEQREMLARSEACKQKWWDVSSQDDAVIFSGQLAHLVRMCHDLERQQLGPSSPVQFRWELGFTGGVLKSNPKVDAGITYEIHCGTMVPFDLDITVRAYWRQFQMGTSPSVTVSSQEVDMGSNVSCRSFSLQFEHEKRRGYMRGKQTCRKHVDNECITILWAGTSWPVEFGGDKFCGLSTYETSWAKLRRVESRSRDGRQMSPCTSVELYSEMVPVFEEGAPNQTEQARALFDMTQQGNVALNDEFCQILSALLLEEDWKARFGSGLVVT